MLSGNDKDDIRTKRLVDPKKWTYKELSKLYKVSTTYICKILNSKVNPIRTGRRRGRREGGRPLLDQVQVKAIRLDDRPLKDIARTYDISTSAVVQIRNRQSYKWVL